MQTASNRSINPSAASPASAGGQLLTLAALAGGAALLRLGLAWVQALWGARGATVGSAPELLTALLAAAALLLAVWLWVNVALVLAATLPGTLGRMARAAAHRVTPALVRHVMAGVIGAGVLGTGVAAPASALTPSVASSALTTSPSNGAAPAGPATSGQAAPGAGPAFRVSATTDHGPGFRASAPTVRPQPSTDIRPVTQRAAPSEGTSRCVVVLRGDSLWSIAAAHLGPGATDAEVAAAWPSWYAANRALIGPDPDLLLPGQQLLIPSPEGPR